MTAAKQADLFEPPPMTYPEAPAHTPDDTSREAARAMGRRSVAICGQVYQLLATRGGFTVHEAANELGLTVPSIQPRFSELRAQDMIYDSGERRVNHASGHRAIVWKAIRFKESM